MDSRSLKEKRFFELKEVMADDIENRDDYYYDISILYVPVNDAVNDRNALRMF